MGMGEGVWYKTRLVEVRLERGEVRREHALVGRRVRHEGHEEAERRARQPGWSNAVKLATWVASV